MTATPVYPFRVTTGWGARGVLALAALCVAYAAIASVTTAIALAWESTLGETASFAELWFDHLLGVAPWIPATALIAVVTPRAFRFHRAAVAIATLGIFGVSLVGTINLVQAGLLTTLGSWQAVPWLDQYVYGLVSAGHFGYLWYVLLTLLAYVITARRPGAAPPAGRDLPPSTIEVESGNARVIIQAEEVDWIEARGDYVRIHAHDREYLKLERMKVLERLLDPTRFARVHRSAIVNLERVREFHPIKRGDYQLTLASGERLRLARSRRKAVLGQLRARTH